MGKRTSVHPGEKCTSVGEQRPKWDLCRCREEHGDPERPKPAENLVGRGEEGETLGTAGPAPPPPRFNMHAKVRRWARGQRQRIHHRAGYRAGRGTDHAWETISAISLGKRLSNRPSLPSTTRSPSCEAQRGACRQAGVGGAQRGPPAMAVHSGRGGQERTGRQCTGGGSVVEAGHWREGGEGLCGGCGEQMQGRRSLRKTSLV